MIWQVKQAWFGTNKDEFLNCTLPKMSDYDDFDDDILAKIDLDTIESKFNNSGINVPLIQNELYVSKSIEEIANLNNHQQAWPDQSSKPASATSKPKKYVQAKLPPAYTIPRSSVVSSIAPKVVNTSNETLAPPTGTEMTGLQSTIHVKLPFENFIKSNHQLNEATKNTWVYPTNYSTRAYQFNISKTCLVKNTLVSLPTGLGKTFIAAVVMYNFYRWFTKGKIVFLAPTKPLVTQQIDACYQITGISEVLNVNIRKRLAN